MKTHISTLIILFLLTMLSPILLSRSWGSVRSETAAPAAEFELVCRSKAKEIAAQTYRGCINENKTAEIERLRKEFQDKLKALKSEYDSEIQKMGGKVKKSPSASNDKSEKRKTIAANPVNSSGSDDMSVAVKPIVPASSDESVMDIPDPVPMKE